MEHKTKKLVSWNVNGLRACMGKGFAQFLEAESPDVICLQETKMQREQADFSFPGYHEYWNSATTRKGYSGTAVFSREEPLSVTCGMGVEEFDGEGRVIAAQYPDFTLVTVYTPNSQRDLVRIDYRMAFEDAFREYLVRLREQGPVIVCGDMNVAHQLAVRTLEMMLAESTTREYYNGETGAGQGLSPFWGWSSLGYVMALEDALEYDPTQLCRSGDMVTLTDLEPERSGL